jgi:hypothetical protein
LKELIKGNLGMTEDAIEEKKKGDDKKGKMERQKCK